MKTLITINMLYYFIGLIVMLWVGFTLNDKQHPKRYSTAFFWFLFGSIFLFGDLMIAYWGKSVAYQFIGALVILIALLAGMGLVSAGSSRERPEVERQNASSRLGNRLFLPALLIPVVTIFCTIGLKGITIGNLYLVDQKQLTLISLGIASIVALLAGCKFTGGSPIQAVRESRRLLDSIGWVVILPQMLAMLGGIFVAAHTDKAVQQLISPLIDPNNRFLLVVIYCVGMALFTMIMGNAFAAFPVMTAGIALPFLIHGQHADVAPLVTIGMLAGYCGTLMTPMGANFNIVPAALLELKDKYLVIKTQIPTAILVLLANILLMYFIVFR